MDKWMVAVAAGANSIAHHFKKLKHAADQKTSETDVSGGVSKVVSANDFDEEKYKGSDGILDGVERGDLGNEPSTQTSRMSFRSRKINRRMIRRPLSSLESCVMAHVEMKEYTGSSSVASPSMQTVRPFFVTDGSNVINMSSVGSYTVLNGSVVKKQSSYSEEKNRFLDATLFLCLGVCFGILYSFMGRNMGIL